MSSFLTGLKTVARDMRVLSAVFHATAFGVGAVIAVALEKPWWAGGLIFLLSFAVVAWTTQFEEW